VYLEGAAGAVAPNHPRNLKNKYIRYLRCASKYAILRLKIKHFLGRGHSYSPHIPPLAASHLHLTPV